jgi:hypothetical protein
VWADAGGEAREVAGVERLRAVAQRLRRVLVDLDDDAVGADRGRRPRERLDVVSMRRRELGGGGSPASSR